MQRVTATLKSGKVLTGSNRDDSFTNASAAIVKAATEKYSDDPIVKLSIATVGADGEGFKERAPRKKSTPAAAAPAPDLTAVVMSPNETATPEPTTAHKEASKPGGAKIGNKR